jgi:uncharacterized membrane protein (UPF0127 family)
MKNALIPLDAIFADAGGRIVSVKSMEPCRVVECPIYSSDLPARYTLEINKGLAKKFNIQTGDQIKIDWNKITSPRRPIKLEN